VPPGWDRWVAKRNTAARTTYYDYGFVDQGIPLQTAHGAGTYATDLFADRALDFLRIAPEDQPYFLYFAPSAPHPPWTPPPRHVDAFVGVPVPISPSVNERNVSDKPAWVQALRTLDAGDLSRLMSDRRQERAALLGVDDAVRRIVEAVEARGDMGRTVIFFLTDNGFSFGEHRIRGKRCPYEECIRTPFAVFAPEVKAGQVDALVSNVDLAPTIAVLAGVRPAPVVDGRSFARALAGRPWKGPPGVLLEWAGDAEIPTWQGVRTHDFVYVENGDGTVELYDLTGARGAADPFELKNRARDPRYDDVVARLAELLSRLRSREPRRG
jgi:arylsulfatase A-like enzyme